MTSVAEIGKFTEIIEEQARSWPETGGPAHLERLSEKLLSPYENHSLYLGLGGYLFDQCTEDRDEHRIVSIGLKPMLAFAYYGARKAAQEGFSLGELTEIMHKPLTLGQMVEIAHHRGANAVRIELLMGLHSQGETLSDIVLKSYDMSEQGFKFIPRDGFKDRQTKPQCRAIKSFDQIFGSIIDICEKEPRLFAATLAQPENLQLHQI